jgi:hypothetical protein
MDNTYAEIINEKINHTRAGPVSVIIKAITKNITNNKQPIKTNEPLNNL